MTPTPTVDEILELLQVVTMRADALAREARLVLARLPDHVSLPTEGLEEAIGSYEKRVPEFHDRQQRKMELMAHREDILAGRPWRDR